MALFQLDPASVVARVRAAGQAPSLPTLAASIVRGIIGFTIVSVAGFLPWPIMGLWLRVRGEIAMYVACTLVFIGLSGLCLHRLIIGPGSLPRFYKLFSLAFVAYAVVWVGCWMTLRGDEGSIGGLLGGTLVMAAILTWAFDATRALPGSAAALFILNTAGYYAGGWIEGKLIVDYPLVAMLSWGACYGIGFGAGLGVAFYLCQARTRAELRALAAA